MSEIITTTGRTASTIAAEIRAYNAQFLYCAFEIGKRLCEAKELVGHGGWMEFLEVEIGYKQSFANNMMRLYREYSVDGQLPNSQAYGNLNPSQALALLALPAGEREEFIQENDVESMSVRQLQAAIKERDAAKKAQADAEAEARKANQDLAAAEKKAKDAGTAEAKLQKEIDRLNAALNKSTAAEEKAKKQVADLKANPKIPEAMKAKLIEEAKAKAVSEASADLQTKLAETQKQLAEMAAAREAAEKEAAAAKEQVANSTKSATLSDPDVAAINVLAAQLAETANKISGHLMKLEKKDPALTKRLKELVANFAGDLKKRMV